MARNKGKTLISINYLKGDFQKVEYIEDIGNCTYFITDGTAIKIGVASSLSNRLNELQTANPREIIPLYVIQSDTQKESLEVERIMHKHFAKNNIRGEWFNLNGKKIMEEIENMGYVLVKPLFTHDGRLKINRPKRKIL